MILYSGKFTLYFPLLVLLFTVNGSIIVSSIARVLSPIGLASERRFEAMMMYVVEVEQYISGNRYIMSRGYKSLEDVKQICLPYGIEVKEINPYTYMVEHTGEIYRIHEIRIQ